MALTRKHQAFVQEYLKDRNGARAARDAGYSKKTARTRANQLLTKLDIKTAVEAGLVVLAKCANITAERNLRRIAEIAYDKISARDSDVLKACELIGKTFGQFKEIQEVSGPKGGPQVIAYIPENGRPNVENKE